MARHPQPVRQAAQVLANTGLAASLNLTKEARAVLDARIQDLGMGGRSAMADLSSAYELPISVLLEVSSVARYRVHGRGERLLLRRSTGNVIFLMDGCVAERTFDDQVVRLWRGGAVFGDDDVVRSALRADAKLYRNSYLTFLSETRTLLIPKDKLRSLAMAEPTTALMLARIGMERAQVVERLYTSNRKSSASRVAALLDYLAGESTVMRAQTVENEDRQLVVKPMRNAVVDGPTQTDISEALTLGRATVERAITQLRKEGALLHFPKGARTYRVYEIGDRDLLQEIARGG
ncbi:Crp/Fnr family transcriptional regulator [Streptomyces sp. TP-A0356]|uniref:Crp/Fnr family transcriptional regulator n=1 Tax=Streptomyces sp. TP-A0356 TaxID=1359208 RepID=UPI0006E2BA54|nr:Crp/Fnr family transcriptional regulator [Streptomyces sp. TP-A0356]